MGRFEKLLVPMLLGIGLLAWLLTSVSADTAVVIARGIGLVLVVLIVLGGIGRTLAKRKRGRRDKEMMAAVIAQAKAEVEARDAAGLTPEATPGGRPEDGDR